MEDLSTTAKKMLLERWPFLVVLLASAHALAAGWGHWGDFIIDTGRELEWPRRLLAGEPLYSQLRYFYGPLAPYLNARLYGLFGINIRVLEIAGAATGVATALTVTALARRFTGRFAAALAGLVFVYVCAFAHILPVGIFNFVLPYSFSATYGMLAALLSLLALLKHVESGGGPSLAFSLAFLVFAALSKVEPLLPALAVHGMFLVTGLITRTHRRLHTIGYACALLGVLLPYGWFFVQIGMPLFRDNLGGALNPGSDDYIRLIMGLRTPWSGILLLSTSLLLLTGTALAGVWTAWLQPPRLPRTAYVVLIGVAASGVLVAAVTMNPDRPYRALPLFVTGATVLLAVRWWSSPGTRRVVLPHLLLAAFASVASFRIFLAAVPQHYGFYLLSPSIVWLVVLFFEYLPGSLPATKSSEAVFACATSLLLGSAGLAHWISLDQQSRKTLQVASPRGSMWVDGELAAAIPILRAIGQTPANSRLLVVPFTTVINFFSGRQGSADGMFAYLPMDFAGGYDDAAVIARWERWPPDYVLWMRGEITEFGYQEFGVTYAQQAGRWIKDHYEPMTNPADQAVLMRRWNGVEGGNSRPP